MIEKIANTEDLLKELLTRLAVAPVLPVQYDAWDTNHIARYMKRSPDTVRREIITQPSFPRPMRIPGAAKAQPLYKAREVIAWLESQTS